MLERRANFTQKVRIENTPFYLCMGEYADGRLGEIFIDAHKQGTFTRGVLDALARMTSLALQCGAPVEEVVKSLKDLNFPPQGVVSGSTEVKSATSIADWIAREIEAVYLKQKPIMSSGEPLSEKSAGYVSDAWRSGV